MKMTQAARMFICSIREKQMHEPSPMSVMKNRPLDNAWRALVGLFTEVLNPLFVIWLALFVCLGYLLTLLMPVRIEHWTALLIATLLLPLAGLFLRFHQLWHAGAYAPLAFDKRALLPLIPLLVFVPLFQAELASPTLQVMNHGDMHVGYVHELLYRATPAQNIFVPGYPANFYWLYHAILAALVDVSDLAPPLVASAVNIIVITSSFYWLSRLLVDLELARPSTLFLGLLIVLVYCSINITGPFSWLASILNDNYHSNSLKILLLPGADRRLESVMNKVLNINSTGVGIADSADAGAQLGSRTHPAFSIVYIALHRVGICTSDDCRLRARMPMRLISTSDVANP